MTPSAFDAARLPLPWPSTLIPTPNELANAVATSGLGSAQTSLSGLTCPGIESDPTLELVITRCREPVETETFSCKSKNLKIFDGSVEQPAKDRDTNIMDIPKVRLLLKRFASFPTFERIS
jgi:hypothetical protein